MKLKSYHSPKHTVSRDNVDYSSTMIEQPAIANLLASRSFLLRLSSLDQAHLSAARITVKSPDQTCQAPRFLSYIVHMCITCHAFTTSSRPRETTTLNKEMTILKTHQQQQQNHKQQLAQPERNLKHLLQQTTPS
ncbi:hypothetical protein PGTUg99_032372 [Puccinia graminis f. sp. tritici]|uniref:Uncharacterized protein n=1 Tax=Puccinia graminis f. sp. tritici TaxID=56615 RepID=A0A5B0N0B3_PUCGR|nr:hypothetical protein PGTUg99_032372 [Puccinia graminis f. sp. tritici]